MSKMAELALDIEELLAEGIQPNMVATILAVPLEMVYETIEQLEYLELEKQYEFISYSEECADDDAQYYGE